MDVQMAQLWFSGKELIRGKKMRDFLGPNEKTKVIVKLQKRGSGRPAREPVMPEEDRKQLMLHAYRRQEELKVRNYILFCVIDKLADVLFNCRPTSLLSRINKIPSAHFLRSKKICIFRLSSDYLIKLTMQ